ENLANLGIGVEYITVVGGDPEGRYLMEELGRRGIPAGGVVVERGRRTTSVHRVLSDGHLLLWMERSSPRDISRRTESELLERLRASADGLSAIVVSDHARGGRDPRPDERDR
ncbi:MAG: PfkB family carbohydrate kinase, partial [Nitrososphaeria archaeon]